MIFVKRFSKLLIILLVFGMLSTFFSACGQNSQNTTTNNDNTSVQNNSNSSGTKNSNFFNETGFPIVNEKMKQKIMISLNPSYEILNNNLAGMYFFDMMEKKTNVNFEFEAYTSDQWAERLNLTFASNELPDIIIGSIKNNDIITYANAKQLIPLNNLLEKYAPDYMKCLNQFPEKAKLYAPDGNMYGFCGTFTGGYAEVPGSRAFINVKWLSNLGLKKPQTFEEFYNVLIAFRDRDPDGNGINDTIPLCGYSSGYAVDPFVAGPLGISFGWAHKDKWQVVDDKLVYVVEHPHYKLYLENMHRLYSEKLLDQEYYTQNDAQMIAKGSKLLIGACTCAAPFVVTNSTDPAIYEQYDVIGPLTSDVFTKKVWYGNNVGSLTIFITSANQHPEVSVRYFNELYTEEGCWLLVGPEAGTWEGDSGGRVWNNDRTSYTYTFSDKYLGTYAYINSVVAPVNSGMAGYRQFSEAMRCESMAPEDVVLLNSLKKNLEYMVPGAPSLFFTPEELEQITLIENSIYTYADQMEAKIVMGEEPLSAYDDMIRQLKAMGLDELTKIYNIAYDRYKVHMK